MKNIHKIDSEIYIISDEKIKVGDYRLNNQRDYFKKADKEGLDYYNKRNDVFKKIILTTDLDLIKDGVQAIDDEFLEWFVKNSSCEEVEIKEKKHFEADKSKSKNPLNGFCYSYKIIIQKEKPKQETLNLDKLESKLEEAAERHIYGDPRKNFVRGAKWMQERSYTEKEVIAIVEKSRKTGLTAEYLIKQFKKK